MSGLLLAARALAAGMPAAAASGLGSFGFIEAEHVLIRFIDQAIGKP